MYRIHRLGAGPQVFFSTVEQTRKIGEHVCSSLSPVVCTPLGRARAGDDDKVLRALADADELEAALQAEKRDKDKVRAAASKEAEAERNRHVREAEDQTARHAADFDECLRQHEQELTR